MTDGTVPLPAWFASSFSHLALEDRRIAARLWAEEPALRRLVQRLDAYRPDRWRPTACALCGNTHIRRTGQNQGSAKVYSWSACEHHFAASLGTPFYRLLPRSYPRLYAMAVVLWGPWTPYFAWRIVGCSDSKQLAHYRRRIAPLLNDLDAQPLVSHAAYRYGFSPAQQGMRCLRCASDALSYAKRRDPQNPCFRCRACGYGFYLTASRRVALPIPQQVHCPSCAGRNLIRKTQRDAGRVVYRCSDCSRSFIFPSKKFQPSKYGRCTTRAVPHGITCPSCDDSNIRVATVRQDGRTIFRCQNCSRQFLGDPKRPPTRIKHTGQHAVAQAPSV